MNYQFPCRLLERSRSPKNQTGKLLLFSLALLGSIITRPATAAIIAAPYSGSYTLTDLGSAAGVPGSYGGLVVKAGDPSKLLLGGNANATSGAIYEVTVIRDGANHITGFSGAASLFATAPNIDGGLMYGPGEVLFYTAFPSNQIGEIKPGSTAPDKIVNLGSLGVTSSVGSLAFVPTGFPGAGSLKIASYNGGGFYDASVTADGLGTYNISPATLQTSPGRGPEGIAYVPLGSPLFLSPSLLLSEYSTGTVGAYKLDADGNPIVGTRTDFITGLTGAEGATIDPLTGDFLFSTFGGGGQHVYVVRGFATVAVPEPATVTLASLGIACLLLRVRGRRCAKGT
jgi:hypothetical protein